MRRGDALKSGKASEHQRMDAEFVPISKPRAPDGLTNG